MMSATSAVNQDDRVGDIALMPDAILIGGCMPIEINRHIVSFRKFKGHCVFVTSISRYCLQLVSPAVGPVARRRFIVPRVRSHSSEYPEPLHVYARLML